ncbi:RNA polymerase-binding protein DksA [Campylobacter estrildidarum]|uniref:RNA polymerase-binding protein DksA n=1 Tax=Campylobacter estrildidarum TaxID=2510189 RepID=A0A4U7BH20_9BACT|nr:RNA polymerase-binding protein DksA [Campylobacter estrildidarum]TKX31068.1 RNA polymerase-binding protein DksA [Campylobacter estrildidarum]
MKKNDLSFFKDNLEQRKKTIEENLKSNSKEIEALHNSAPSDSVDFSIIETNSQIDFTISANLKQELKDIEASLNKIKDKTYGICESCDEEISIERLKIKPHAKYCVACRENLEKKEKL